MKVLFGKLVSNLLAVRSSRANARIRHITKSFAPVILT